MDYGTFERLLAELHEIHDGERKTFKARLRILRDAGLPNVTKPGKGSRIEYDASDLWYTHLVLILGRFGIPPLGMRTFDFVGVSEFQGALRMWKSVTNDNVWACFARGKPNSHIKHAKGRSGLSWEGAPTQDERLSMFRRTRYGHLVEVTVSPIYNLARLLSQVETSAFFGLVNISKIDRECADAIQSIQ